jgi:exodeoxyribonuclease-3
VLKVPESAPAQRATTVPLYTDDDLQKSGSLRELIARMQRCAASTGGASSMAEILQTYKIATWNLNGVRARLRDGSFFTFLERSLPDVLLVQEFRCGLETFLRKRGVKARLEALGYRFVIVVPSSSNIGYAGVAIFSRIRPLELASDVGDSTLDDEGRFLLVDFGGFRLANVYAPNSGEPGNLRFLCKRLRFDTALRKTLSLHADKPLLLVGDLNVVSDLDKDVFNHHDPNFWKEHPSTSLRERQSFAKLMREQGFVDAQDFLRVSGFTFWRTKAYKANDLGMRVDYVLAPPEFLKEGRLSGLRVRPDIGGSDHAPIEFSLSAHLFTGESKTALLADPSTTLEAIAAATEECPSIPGPHGAQAISDALSSLDYEQRPLHPSLYDDAGDDDALGFDDFCLAESLLGVTNKETIRSVDPVGMGTVPLGQWDDILVDELAHGPTESVASISDPHLPGYIMERRPVILPSIELHIADKGTNRSTSATALGDTGASSSFIDISFLRQALQKNKLYKLFKGGYNPRFRTADGRFTSPVGQFRLSFLIGDVEFTHVFYVLESCAHNVILGGDFFDRFDADISYRNGTIVLHSDVGSVSCPFRTCRTTACSLSRPVTLVSATDGVISPGHSLVARAVCAVDEVALFGSAFGFVEVHQKSPGISIPRGCTRSDEGATPIVVTNFSTEHVHLKKGQPIATYCPWLIRTISKCTPSTWTNWVQRMIASSTWLPHAKSARWPVPLRRAQTLLGNPFSKLSLTRCTR